MTAANELPAHVAARRICAGDLKIRDLVEACLDRIDQRDEDVRAWVHLDPSRLRQAADRLDGTPVAGPLFGLPVGIKDIIDTADQPTAYGSPIYARHQPRSDAVPVAQVRAAGGLIAGKTVTTEFAYFSPGPTRNPHNPAHTPGGSSSGSAAAVADFQVPLAFGTQTAGSVIRPAAYCGVVGYKPTFDDFNLTGVKCFSPALDTLGLFARAVADLSLLRRALAADHDPPGPVDRAPVVGIFKVYEWDQADAAMQAAVETTAESLAGAGATVLEVTPAEVFAKAAAAQNRLMAFDACRSFLPEYQNHGEQLSPQLSQLIEQGLALGHDDYLETAAIRRQCLAALEPVFQEYDLLMMPAAPGEAPAGLEATGDPVFNRIPTFLGLPCLALPGHTGPNGLPLGIQFVGRRHGDRDLLAAAAWIEPRLAG